MTLLNNLVAITIGSGMVMGTMQLAEVVEARGLAVVQIRDAKTACAIKRDFKCSHAHAMRQALLDEIQAQPTQGQVD